MQLVKLTKVAAAPNPWEPTPETYEPGAGKGIPLEYWVKGELLKPIAIGERIVMNRSERNGILIPGIFITTPVTAIDGKVIVTANSVYHLEDIDSASDVSTTPQTIHVEENA